MSETKIDISRASKAIRDSRFVEALSMLESNLAKDPDHLESLYFAAVCSRYLKNYKDSENCEHLRIALSIKISKKEEIQIIMELCKTEKL